MPVQINGSTPSRKPSGLPEQTPPAAPTNPPAPPPPRRGSPKRAPLRDALTDVGIARDRVRRATQALRVREEESAGTHRPNELARRLEIIEMPIGEIKSARRRGRRTSAAQLARLRASLRRFGFSLPVVVDRHNGLIVGHGLIDAAIDLGFETAPVVRRDDLSPEDAEYLALTLNRLGETGEWDIEALKPILLDFADDGEDLALMGFDDAFVDTVLADEEELRPERPLELPEFVVSRLGDVWQVDEGRVGCTPGEDVEAVKAVTVGTEVKAVFQDFPYNVPIEGFVTSKSHKTFVMGAGELTREAFEQLLLKMLIALFVILAPGGVVFGCMDWRSIDLLMRAARAAGFEIITLVIWAKGTGGQPGGLYRSAHELILVMRKPGGTMINNVKGGKYRTNVWTYPGGASFGSESREGGKSHSTAKGISMVSDAFADVTRRGDAVADFCLGGGTTLIAAQRTGRVFYGGDLDPLYVDVSILRWQRETGREARLLATGETYAEVAARRLKEAESAAKPVDPPPSTSPARSVPTSNC